MKEEYIKPETLIMGMDGEVGIICSSSDSFIFNPGIAGREIEID
jgi:hypothetical protein